MPRQPVCSSSSVGKGRRLRMKFKLEATSSAVRQVAVICP